MNLKDPSLFRESCFINGEWLGRENEEVLQVLNPADMSVLGRVPSLNGAAVDSSIDSSRRAFETWKLTKAKERSAILKRWHSLIIENKDDLAVIITSEQGKPMKEALAEVYYGASFVEWFAEESKRVYGDVIPESVDGEKLIVIKQPVGVVAAITPWNFPLAMVTRKCAPALAAGCTVILKPAESTPLTSLALAELARRAGFPPGVLNVITGEPRGIGSALTSSPLVSKVTFTGSTAVGKLLMKQCADTVKRVSLELGGNAPFIVFDDADIDAAVEGVLASKYRNTGQTCVCANRILVQDKVYDLFAEKLKEKVNAMRVGNGLTGDTDQGPLINEAAVLKVEKHIKDALSKGAKLLTGGKRHTLGGTFFEPTIITDVDESMIISMEETFGPVAPLFRFKTEDEAIRLANNTSSGLAAYFYTRDVGRVWRVSEALEYGIVGMNKGVIAVETAPFGGFKESGIGREGSKYGIQDFLEIKYICMGGLGS